MTRPVHRPEPVIDRSPAWESYLSVRSVIGVGEREHLRRVARAIASATRSSNGNFVRCRPARPWGAADRSGFPTSEREVALIFPTRDPGFARLDEGRSDRCFAVGREATGIVVGPRIEPDQGRHMAILGETGMGKSSLLIALSRQASRWGGLLLLDPLGETAEAVRETLGGRLGERLVTVDPVGPHALNALASLGPATSAAPIRRERQLNELVAALRRVRSGRYVDSGFWGPRLEEILTRALDAAASLPGGTLATAHSLLEAEGRGFRHVPADAMDAVRALGERIRARPEDADGARRLLFEVTRSPTLSRMLCSASPDLTAADLVRPGRVVLVSGLAEVVGETSARYFTAVILALAWSELLARPELSKTCVILDEAQWFAHDSLAEMLRLGRRRNVHVILATQALGSLPESVADAVRTNVADFVLYRGSPEEAREASRTAPSLVASSLLALPRGKAVVLLGKGASVHWVRTARAPPADVPWPTRPSPGSAEDPGPAGIGPDLPAIDRGLVAVDQVLGEIRRMAEGSPDRGPIRVSLEHLRRSVDREGSGVRRAGSELRRSGAIVGSGRDDHGAYWRIDAGRLGLGGGDGGGTRAPATPAQGPESSPAAPSAGEEPRDP